GVVRALRQKAAQWPDLRVSRRGFRDPAVRQKAAEEYDGIADQLEAGATLPDYDAAFDAILRFVDALDLPERA
ncbi:MAG: hypothetical protein R3362_02010, partial [Rhodothermales bacterium]|nr:hypothetical protein [Rhodothermales bacterium]